MDLLAAHINFDAPDDVLGVENCSGTEVPEPTGCPPGTIGKVYTIMRRAMANQELWHVSDAKHAESFCGEATDLLWPQQMLLPWERKRRRSVVKKPATTSAYWYAFDWVSVATILKLYSCTHVQVSVGGRCCGDMLRNGAPVLTFSVPAKATEKFVVRVLVGRKVGEFAAGLLLTPLQQSAAIGPSFWSAASLSIFSNR